ncbi:MAG: helix-turn-helix transcriptional regulator [Acidobacteriota bacterium]
MTLLRNKIREQGFTQLEVQDALSWGRSYISQLLTKQKSLRVEQVLKILNVIAINPADFFAELYRFPIGEGGDYSNQGVGRAPLNPSVVSEGPAPVVDPNLRETRALMRALVQVLTEKNLLGADELTQAVRSHDPGTPFDLGALMNEDDPSF